MPFFSFSYKKPFFNIFLAVFLFFLPKNQSLAQEQTLTLQEYYTQIINYHPLVKQANTLTEFAKMELRIAKGAFDPKLGLDYFRKDFDKKNYFETIESKLKIPNWIGEVQMGFEQSKGAFVNPENTTDTQGLLSAGVSVPLLKGLLIDERRNMLKQAQFFQQINEAEKVKVINKILFQASKDYWEWYFAYRELFFLQTGLELAQTRYEAVKKRVTNGELAGIDSVQAKIILQERQIQLQQARLEIQNDRLVVANHLWGENNTPRLLDDNTIPQAFLMQPFQPADLENLKNYAQNYHPELQKLKYKGFQLGTEARYQRNTLLPKLDVQYNLLSNFNPTTDTNGWNAQRNYKLGVNFEFPLFLRKERGKFQQTRIKQNQNELEITQTQREIQTQIQTAYNELKTLEEQMKIQEVMVQNYQILRNGEYVRFLNGESSLFLINTQETKLIESQIKYEAQKSKYGKARAMLIWVSGGQTWE